jgi:hypothetical protein
MGKARELARLPNGPAFAASASAATSLAATAYTKVLFATEDFDTNANFASSRFTPTVAGYYQINACVQITGSIPNALALIYKNGSAYRSGGYEGAAQVDPIKTVNALVYLNGSTDYVEVFAFNGAASPANTVATASVTWFDGHLARVA